MTNNTDKPCDENKASDQVSIDSLLSSEQASLKIAEAKDILDKLSQTLQEAGKWSKSTLQLMLMELLRNFVASRKILFCQLLFIPLLILFIVSVCIAIGIVSYSITMSLLIGVAGFLTSFSAVLIGLALWHKHLISFLGFKETMSQVKEGIDVISKATQSFD